MREGLASPIKTPEEHGCTSLGFRGLGFRGFRGLGFRMYPILPSPTLLTLSLLWPKYPPLGAECFRNSPTVMVLGTYGLGSTVCF